MSPRRVLIVLPEHAHLLDVTGPAQVFTHAAELTGAFEVRYVAANHSVRTHQGLTLNAATHWPELTARDLVIVTGWRADATDTPLAPWLLREIRQHWDRGGQLASVCAGSLVLAELGILAGHRATTHHDLIPRLRRTPAVSVVENVLYTCEDRLHTSAGIASGIDLSLHLVAHAAGPALAARIARTLVVPAWRPGASPQASALLLHRNHMDDLIHRAQDRLSELAKPAPSLAALGRELGVSGRTLARRFSAATGVTPHAYGRAARLERAEQLRAQGWTQEAAAAAVGYSDARSLRPRGR